ncbi:MAG TPA: NAD(P)H-dependent oxidoreductase subunit E [Ignavibacteriaceae bacterium]|jgi:NADH-quinone oxidoreductase E subunit|nr:NAD(P)H-dependent oxidoreductase subunit E [Ignavibacteriaceae bacterium]HOJ17671.1 NAD(P)H-dependent oxidoreductase subunit E [Ignavibacteriaceae bacterium]
MQFEFNEENLRKIEILQKKYPDKRSSIMPVLYIAQEQNGWISGEVMIAVAALLGIPESEVLGVVTFYTMYHKKPVGKYHLQVCTNVSCMLRGGYRIWEKIKEKYDLDEGTVSPDGKFSLEEVECMGSCGTAPMIAINDDFFENLTPGKAIELIDSLK